MPCETKTDKEQPTCFHTHTEQLKRLQSGDHKNLKDEIIFQLPSRTEFSAFLEIGAEAERRNEAIIKEMQCVIKKYSAEIELLRRQNCSKMDRMNELHKKVCDQENTIQSLTIELYDGNQETANDLSFEIAQLEQEKEGLQRENENLNCKMSEIYSKFNRLQEAHQQCTTKKALIAKEVCFLNNAISERDKKIKEDCYLIDKLKQEVSCLSSEVTRLREKLDSQCEQFVDKSSSYQRLICDLQSQVNALELSLVEVDEYWKNVNYGTRDINQSDETDISSEIAENDRILHHMDSKLEKDNKNIESLLRFETKENPENERATKLYQQERELNCKPAEDSEYNDLLKEISQLHYEVYNSAGESQNGSLGALLCKLKRIKCRIKSRLQEEQTKRKKISKQIDVKKCEFMQMQKEIEDLRKKSGTNALIREEIKARVEKEKQINQFIQRSSRCLKELHRKCSSLSKGLININKVQDLVISVNERCV